MVDKWGAADGRVVTPGGNVINLESKRRAFYDTANTPEYHTTGETASQMSNRCKIIL